MRRCVGGSCSARWWFGSRKSLRPSEVQEGQAPPLRQQPLWHAKPLRCPRGQLRRSGSDLLRPGPCPDLLCSGCGHLLCPGCRFLRRPGSERLRPEWLCAHRCSGSCQRQCRSAAAGRSTGPGPDRRSAAAGRDEVILTARCRTETSILSHSRWMFFFAMTY